MSNHNMNFHGDNKNINAFLLKKVPYLDQQKYQYFLAAKMKFFKSKTYFNE